MRCVRGQAPLEGSCHGVAMTERCYRTESFPQGFGVCRRRFRAAAAVRRHTSPSRFACPRVATKPSRPALRSAKASGCPTAAVASSAAGGAPLRASPQGEALGCVA